MSLGIVFKGPEGIVLAADSRVTLHTSMPSNQPNVVTVIPATYDNATKLLHAPYQKHIGVVTYGAGGIGQKEVRTAHSFMPEFEDWLGNSRLSVEEYSKKLSEFFQKQWKATMPATYKGPDMVFLIGGYDYNAPYGRIFEIHIPSQPTPVEQVKDTFGITWGGQREIADRLIQGFDDKVPELTQTFFQLPENEREKVRNHLRGELTAKIPYQFLPLQDCVDFSIFIIRATIMMQNWTVGLRGVGGAIDVAIITRTDGFKAIQQKIIIGE